MGRPPLRRTDFTKVARIIFKMATIAIALRIMNQVERYIVLCSMSCRGPAMIRGGGLMNVIITQSAG